MLRLSVSDLLDVAPRLVTAGNPTIFLAVKNKEIVDRSPLDARKLRTLIGANPEPLCVFVLAPTLEGPIRECLLLSMGYLKAQQREVPRAQPLA